MEKVIRDGKVAVAISPGFGAGWTTWNRERGLTPFHPQVIDMIEKGKENDITEEWCEEVLGIRDIYCGGAPDLEIEWIPQGIRFIIGEYDGSERLEYVDDVYWEA